MPKSLGRVLKEAREKQGLSLRKVEGKTGIHNAHLSQIESDTIGKPDIAMLWELASLYGLDYAKILRLAGYSRHADTPARERQRMTAAFRAMDGLTPREQTEALRYMAELKGKRASG
jgi:transcriptional regulator with XRE-family HTH domain